MSRQPSIWTLIHSEHSAFIAQFVDERSHERAGLTDDEAELCQTKFREHCLKGITRGPRGQWQIRVSINHAQHILFVSYCITTAALLRDLLLSVLYRYPHCASKYCTLDPAKEDARFNLPLATREHYANAAAAPAAWQSVKDVCNFVASVEKLLLDKGILYPISPEEQASRKTVSRKAEVYSAIAAQKRYHTRRATQLEQVLEQIQDTANKLSELATRLGDLFAGVDKAGQRMEFNSAVCESLRIAVEANTTAFKQLVEEAHSAHSANTKHQHEQQQQPSQPFESNQYGISATDNQKFPGITG